MVLLFINSSFESVAEKETCRFFISGYVELWTLTLASAVLILGFSFDFFHLKCEFQFTPIVFDPAVSGDDAIWGTCHCLACRSFPHYLIEIIHLL